MLDPDYLSDVSLELEQTYYNLETELLKDIAKEVKNMDYLKDTSEFNKNLFSLEVAKKTSQKIAKVLNISQDKADQIVSKAAYKSVEADNEIFKEAFDKGILPQIKFNKNSLKSIINTGIDSLNNELENICRTTAKASQNAFINACNNAYLQIQSGAVSYDTAITREIKKVAKDGLGIIEYRSGARRHLEGAIRNAVRTATNQTALKCQDANFEEMGGNLVETSSHMGARPEHALWQGEIFWRKEEVKGYRNFEEATKYGSGEGLGGWNCRHSWFPYFPSISSKVFEQFNYKENEELYNLTQEQRYNERMIREWDRRTKVCRAAGIDDAKEARKVKEWKERQSSFLNKHPELTRQYSREKGYISYKEDGKIDLSSITISGALDPSSKRASKHAERYYDSIRKMKTDCKKIALNTGYSEDLIKKIKSYSFIDEHDLITGKRTFYPSYHMAQSWQRLIDGKNIQPHDLLLLDHEMYEMILVNNGISQLEAHNLTNKIYNYKEGCDQYDSIFEKFYKK